jgi:hypothetical protein
MAAGSTYTPIATTTLGTAASSVTFSSISGAYTDLVLVTNIKGSTASYPQFRLNSDTASNYSDTELGGNGTSAVSGRNSNSTLGYFSRSAVFSTSNFSFNAIINFQNYSNTTTYKTWLSRANEAGSETDAVVGLWRSTSAITSIVVSAASGTMEIGSTFSLYGIAAA